MENSNQAREVAELLMGAAIPTWFAEYRIPADERFDSEDFINQAIDGGVQGAGCAILLTNDRWAESAYCHREASGLLQRLPADRIAEIQIPPQARPRVLLPQLSQISDQNRWVYNGQPAVLADFLNGLGWFSQRLSPTAWPRGEQHGRHQFRFGLSLDWNGLGFRSADGHLTVRAQQLYSGDVRRFSASIQDCEVSAVVAARPYETSVELDSIAAFDRHGDAMVHRQYRRLARTYASGLEGTHLFFRNNHGQLAITCGQIDPNGTYVFERRYLVVEQRTHPCPFCLQSKLVPYEKRFDGGKGIVRLACGTCGSRREIPVETLKQADLEQCAECAPRLRTNISVLEPDSDCDRWLYCLNPACGKRFSEPPSSIRPRGEVHLSFAVGTGESSRASALAVFLRCVQAFDAVARSIEWEERPRRRDPEWWGTSAVRLAILVLLGLSARAHTVRAIGTSEFKAAWWATGIVAGALVCGGRRHRAVVSLGLLGQQIFCRLFLQRPALMLIGSAFGVGADLLICAIAAIPFAAIMAWAGWRSFPNQPWFWLVTGLCSYLTGIWLIERRSD